MIEVKEMSVNELEQVFLKANVMGSAKGPSRERYSLVTTRVVDGELCSLRWVLADTLEEINELCASEGKPPPTLGRSALARGAEVET